MAREITKDERRLNAILNDECKELHGLNIRWPNSAKYKVGNSQYTGSKEVDKRLCNIELKPLMKVVVRIKRRDGDISVIGYLLCRLLNYYGIDSGWWNTDTRFILYVEDVSTPELDEYKKQIIASRYRSGLHYSYDDFEISSFNAKTFVKVNETEANKILG